MKSTFAAVLATTCIGHEFTLYAFDDNPGDFPKVSVPMTFEQTAGQGQFNVLID